MVGGKAKKKIKKMKENFWNKIDDFIKFYLIKRIHLIIIFLDYLSIFGFKTLIIFSVRNFWFKIIYKNLGMIFLRKTMLNCKYKLYDIQKIIIFKISINW